MTGYGRVNRSFKEKVITIELKSLNSKYTDIRLKVPQNYREKEADFRKILLDKIQRGKIEMSLEIKSTAGDDEYGLNGALFKKYFLELTSLSKELDIQKGDMIQSILRLPNVVATAGEEIDETEWGAVLEALNEAVASFDQFRIQEGEAMKDDLNLRITNIVNLLDRIDPHEQERVDNLRTRLHQKLEEHVGRDKIDENRFEQEIIFYLEKMDINEEKVRLLQHCKYFQEELEKKISIKGRKLSFIGQEIGREINTLGAKAYASNIQRLVVEMKDELEKVKEQVANSV